MSTVSLSLMKCYYVASLSQPQQMLLCPQSLSASPSVTMFPVSLSLSAAMSPVSLSLSTAMSTVSLSLTKCCYVPSLSQPKCCYVPSLPQPKSCYVLSFPQPHEVLLCPQIETRLSTEGRRFIVYPHRVDGLWDRINIFITTRSSSDVLVSLQCNE